MQEIPERKALHIGYCVTDWKLCLLANGRCVSFLGMLELFSRYGFCHPKILRLGFLQKAQPVKVRKNLARGDRFLALDERHVLREKTLAAEEELMAAPSLVETLRKRGEN
jgi:hypothetical protein